MQINLKKTMPTLKLSLHLTSSTYKSILPKSPNTLLLLATTTQHPIILSPPIRCTSPLPNPLVCYNYNTNNNRVHFRGDRYTIIDRYRYRERVVCFSSSSSSSSSSSEMGFETPPPTPEKQQQKEKLMTLPTILTIGRVLSVPLLVATFYVDSWWGTTSTTSIFIIAAITDWLDGYIARKMRLGSAFGAFLDPVADKLMVAATLILLCTRPFEVPVFGQVPWVLTVPAIAIIGREITMSAVREWAASQNGKLSEAVAVNNLGKWKTATQMTALIILLATRDSSLAQSGTLVGSGVVLLYVSAWLSIWSLVVYMRKIWKVLLK